MIVIKQDYIDIIKRGFLFPILFIVLSYNTPAYSTVEGIQFDHAGFDDRASHRPTLAQTSTPGNYIHTPGFSLCTVFRNSRPQLPCGRAFDFTAGEYFDIPSPSHSLLVPRTNIEFSRRAVADSLGPRQSTGTSIRRRGYGPRSCDFTLYRGVSILYVCGLTTA